MWRTKNCEDFIGSISPRGGSTIASNDEIIIIFGGADRNQNHFSDLIIRKKSSQSWEEIETHGDVPAPRSGHSVAFFGKYMILFGGIDFGEEVAYNDLYTFNTESYEWNYVGESGEEISGRNSHSMEVLPLLSSKYSMVASSHVLVVYGGASPEHGPLGDVYYAELPDPARIDPTEFFVKWQKVTNNVGRREPGPREMHSSCCFESSMIISGGRDGNGCILSDTWILEASVSTSTTTTDSSESESLGRTSQEIQLQWRVSEELELPAPRCAHAATVSQGMLCVYGGFTGEGISADILTHSLTSSSSAASSSIEGDDGGAGVGSGGGGDDYSHGGARGNGRGAVPAWVVIGAGQGIGGRFGHCVCPAPRWYTESRVDAKVSQQTRRSGSGKLPKAKKQGGQRMSDSHSESDFVPDIGLRSDGTTAAGTTVDGTTAAGTTAAGTTVDGTTVDGTIVDGTTAAGVIVNDRRGSGATCVETTIELDIGIGGIGNFIDGDSEVDGGVVERGEGGCIEGVGEREDIMRLIRVSEDGGEGGEEGGELTADSLPPTGEQSFSNGFLLPPSPSADTVTSTLAVGVGSGIMSLEPSAAAGAATATATAVGRVDSTGMLLFGGVSAEKDYSDLWLLIQSSS